MQRVLAAHPDVAAVPGETYLFSRGIAPLLDRFQHGSLASPMLTRTFAEPEAVHAHLRGLVVDVFEPYLRAGSADRLVERTPEHVGYMQTIARLFPRTRFVHVIRDGRAVVRSLLAQPWGPVSPAEAAREWRTAVEAGRRQAGDLAHYREVRYERLRGDTEAELRALFAWLGLEDSDTALAAPLVEAGIVANTGPRSGRPALGVRARRQVRSEAGDLLRELGYRRPSPRPSRRRDAAPASPRAVVTSIHEAQSAADQVLEVLRGLAPPAGIAHLVEPDVDLELTSNGVHRRWRRPDGLSALAAAAAELPGLRAPQTGASQHASRHQYTVVVRAPTTEGNEVTCTVVVGFGRHGIRSVAVHG